MPADQHHTGCLHADSPSGHHPRPIGGSTVTSDLAHIDFGALRHLADTAPRPILLVTGDQAHSKYFSDEVHEQARGPKELVVVPGARHIDLYHRTRRAVRSTGADARQDDDGMFSAWSVDDCSCHRPGEPGQGRRATALKAATAPAGLRSGPPR